MELLDLDIMSILIKNPLHLLACENCYSLLKKKKT